MRKYLIICYLGLFIISFFSLKVFAAEILLDNYQGGLSPKWEKKEGDDYAARIYVVFPSLVFWKTRTINYIWANKLPPGKAVTSPFTKNSIMIAVESGESKTGRWIEEKRNVFEDFRKHFRQDPPRVGAIAIMTDTDNTGEKAVAWYGPIRILCASSH